MKAKTRKSFLKFNTKCFLCLVPSLIRITVIIAIYGTMVNTYSEYMAI